MNEAALKICLNLTSLFFELHLLSEQTTGGLSMESARAKNFTKQLSAVISNDDYEFLKKTSENYGISLGDVVRGVIKQTRLQNEEAIKQEKRQKQTRLF